MSACEENYNSGNGECNGCESGECGGCGSNGGCSGCCGAKTDFREPVNKWSNIKKVIGIVSGKGGVGKSSVTSLMACAMRNAGKNVGILDADITGPSIPKAFGISEKALGNQDGIFPVQSATGIDVMSVNLLLENDTDPVVWRGSMIANAVKQFWGDVIWGDQDYLFVDMPPGTGDVPLTVFQSLPVDGIIIVTSPQELVSMIVGKAVKMAQMMNVPILGIVENMSYFHCPDNGKDYQIFGESHIEEVAEEYGVQVLGRMPIDPMIAQACDGGRIEFLEKNPMEMVAAAVDRQFA
jgi:Mrp family chromosome partitioning ATPase